MRLTVTEDVLHRVTGSVFGSHGESSLCRLALEDYGCGMVEDFHICQPPMEQRSASAPREWRCPDCGTWWAVEPAVPPEVAPAFDFLTHQGIVPARWVLQESG